MPTDEGRVKKIVEDYAPCLNGYDLRMTVRRIKNDADALIFDEARSICTKNKKECDSCGKNASARAE